ncbi:type IV pilin protein [Massilia sp. H6]|uniref:type IV pilin protein n=1 Tax=Massilia sp. H6 TaxID=2970464 RepID=UPI00216A7750|nr:type IV pilin protein [Massilia sp. H6]UVW30090.1 prepilin-type N-terminal cleavage/methylation domain-containing protein [Massilia sp. H6]
MKRAQLRAGRMGGPGFTLVELLVVMAILAILAAIAYPSYASHLVRMQRVEAQLALVDAMQRQEQYRAQHHTYVAFSSASDIPHARQFRWWLGSRPQASAYELDGYACDGQDIGRCIVLRARPGTANVDTGFDDPDCGVLTFDSTGAQGASGSGARCWP